MGDEPFLLMTPRFSITLPNHKGSVIIRKERDPTPVKIETLNATMMTPAAGALVLIETKKGRQPLYTYLAVTRHAVYTFKTRQQIDKPSPRNRYFRDSKTEYNLVRGQKRARGDARWGNLHLDLLAGAAPYAPKRFLEKKTYESEFRAVDPRAPPLSKEAYEFLDEVVQRAVLEPLRGKEFTSTWFTSIFGYYDKEIPGVVFGNSSATSRNMFDVGREGLKRSFANIKLPDFETTITDVKTWRMPHFSSIRIWRALRLLFRTKAETNHATAIVVRFIRLIYKHMKDKAGKPYYPKKAAVRAEPGLEAKANAHGKVRFALWTWKLPEDYEISKQDIIKGLAAKSDDNTVNFAAVFNVYPNIFKPDARTKAEKVTNSMLNKLKKGFKLANAK